MKWLILSFIYLLNLSCIFSQCDSIHLEVQRRSDILNLLNTYSERTDFVTKTVDHFLHCEYFENAIGWQEYLVYLAKSESLIDRIKYLQILDSLMSIHKVNLSQTIKNDYKIKSLVHWSEINQKIGHHSKTLEQLKSVEDFLKVKIEDLPSQSVDLIAKAFRKIGVQYNSRREYGLAIQYFERSLFYSQFIKNEIINLRSKALVQGYLSATHFELKNLKNAKYYTLRQLKNAKLLSEITPKYSGNLSKAYENLSKWHILNGTLDSAEIYIATLEILDKNISNFSFKNRMLRAEVEIGKNNLNKAKSILSKLLSDFSSNENLINVVKEDKSIRLAKLLSKCQAHEESNGLISAIEKSIRNKLQKKKNKESPVFYIQEGQLVDILLYQISLSNQSNIESIYSKVDSAFNLINEGLQNSSSRRDKLNFANQSYTLTDQFLQHVPFEEQNYLQEILFSMESSKAATSFTSWLQNQVIDLSNEEDLFYVEQNCHEKIGDLFMKKLLATDQEIIEGIENEIKLYEVSLDSCKQLLEELHPTYFQMRYNWSIPKLKAVKSCLAHDEVLVSYFEGKKFLYAIVISNEETKFIKFDSIDVIKPLIKKLSSDIYSYQGNTRAENNFGSTSNRLYQHLIAPIETLLKERVIISPSGSLFQVPFSALTISPNEILHFRAENFLLSKYAISYSPSVSFFLQQRKLEKDINIRNALLVAPTFEDVEKKNDLIVMRSSLGKLIYNTKEVEMVSTLVNNDLLLGKNATKSAVSKKIQNQDLIHFSTHAKSNDDIPDKSFIAFYTENESFSKDTSRLYFDELSKLHLSSKMIVLSACETGLGQVFEGEGAMSLANACFYSGAQSVIASLWSVQDRSSFDIITSFYKHLDDGLPKDKAMQMAKLDYLKINTGEWNNPYFWAGFTVIGNSDSIRFEKDISVTLWILSLLILLFTLFVFIRFKA